METPRRLIVGLGNPGRGHANNRHNAGFMLIEALAEDLGLTRWQLRCESLVAESGRDAGMLILAMPQTYMNESGRAVRCLLREFSLAIEQLLVVFDDLDLPTGELRLRPGGGSSGHRGMESILQQLSADNFPRLRIGIGRPPGKMDPADYVLQDFSAEEREQLLLAWPRGVECLRAVLDNGLEQAMTACNTVSQ